MGKSKNIGLVSLMMLIVGLLSVISVQALPTCDCGGCGPCMASKPTCDSQLCDDGGTMCDGVCIPEFSGYASIAAIIGAIGISVLISRFKKKA